MSNEDRSMRVAAVQMVSGMTVEDNLAQAAGDIETAVSSGAGLVALPEYFCFMEPPLRNLVHLTMSTTPVERTPDHEKQGSLVLLHSLSLVSSSSL